MKRLTILTGLALLGLTVPGEAQTAKARGATSPGVAAEVASLETKSQAVPGLGSAKELSIGGTRAECWTLEWLRVASEANSDEAQPCQEVSPGRLLPRSAGAEASVDTANLPQVRATEGYSSSGTPDDSLAVAPVRPAVAPREPRAEGVHWGPLMKGSLRYLAVMHGFRLATEAGTRQGLSNSVVGGYFKALGSLHGWSDGDTYYENYLGHPIQGSVSAYLWIHNDKERFRNVEFGRSRDYWMSRLRAYAFAWAFSEQFEIGPISEASIGQIQRYCCQYGFVDHVITPNGGMVWVLGEDMLDKYVVRRIEDHTSSTGLRIAARVALNPVQSFANFMNFEYPWLRENRAAPSDYVGQMYPKVQNETAVKEFPLVPKFEIAAAVPELMRFGNLSCLGGGGVAGFRMRENWQWTLEVSGCTLGNSLPTNWSGDSLSWTMGPQWIRHGQSRWTPHAHFRVGGQKVTEKQVNPEVLSWVGGPAPMTDGENSEGQKHWESTGFSMSMGGGLDVRLNAGLAWRFANLDYVRSWLGQLNGVNFDHGFRFTTGVVLRIGTW